MFCFSSESLSIILEKVCTKHITHCVHVIHVERSSRRRTGVENRRRQILAVLFVFLLMIATVPMVGTQSNLALAGFSGAKLTGVIHDDEGVDADGDGLFDYLRVGVQVNVTESGIYRVSIHGLVSSNGSYIPIYDDTSMYLDVGLQAVNVQLYGPTIYLSGLNPVNVSSISLHDADWNWLGDVNNVPLSREYSYTKFDAPSASLTGVISDKGIDTDGDGLFNYLGVDVEINVTEAGYYEVSISDLLDSHFYHIGAYDSRYVYLDVGIQTITLTLYGLSIYMSGRNPAYVAYICLRDASGRDIGSRDRVPLSKEYSYLNFDPPKAVLTGKIYDQGLDKDGDRKFDYLQIGVEINVTDSGYYKVEISGLQDSSDHNIDVWGGQSGYFDFGIHVLNVSLYGPTIYAWGLNPRYVSSIHLYDDYYSYRSSVPLSHEYLFSDFDPPSAVFTGVVFDRGVDTDGDRQFNYLEVGFQINVTEAGNYGIWLSGLLDSNRNRLDVDSSVWTYLDKGTHVIYLKVDGIRIHMAGFNPRYIDYVSLHVSPGDESKYYIGSLDDASLSKEYSYKEFEAPGAVFTKVFYDQGVDTDDDEKFNYLQVGVEVNVTEAGKYSIRISGLLDAYSNYIDVWGSEYVYLNVGTHVVNVSLSGLAIYLSGLNPKYIKHIFMTDEHENKIGTLENVPLSQEYLSSEFDPPGAILTGVIFDQGVDTDADGTYDYLQIGVEVNVTDAGKYHVSVSGLLDSRFKYIDVYDSNFAFLDAGLQIVYLYLEGPRIYLSGLNPRYIEHIELSDERYTYYDHLRRVLLSKEYSYKRFDPPTAMLTGRIYDRGVDTDDDGAFNYLEVGVEINVTKPGTYRADVSELRDIYGKNIGVWGSQAGYFDVGLGVLNVSLYGPSIYASRLNPRYVSHIGLSADYYSSIHDVPLSKEYSYTQFDFPAVLTGRISDRGIDTDSDGSFDYLEIGVEVNVSDPGTYVLSVSGLLDYKSYINVRDSKTIYLNAGVQTVNLYLYGPQIYATRRNPTRVSYISLTVKQYMYDYYYHDSLHDVPLSEEYSYIEFDAPFVDVETKFVVYPDGRVAVEGALNYTHMVPENMPRYTMAQGFFNLTGDGVSSQASAGLTLNLPTELASEFPFNSTTARMLAEYSNGLLDLGINSTMILPSIAESVYPFNTTDGTLTATYSGGIFNIEVEGNTTLPRLASQQFPFNATNLTVVGTYSQNKLDGTITFSILDEFIFDNVDVDFKGNQTDLTFNGTLHVVFNVPLGDFIIRNGTELIQMIDRLESELPGVVWNVTGGLLNVTNLDIDYVLNGMGASVTFKINVHGNFVRALAYIMSGGRNEMLLCPVLNEAYQSVQSGSFDIRYSYTTLRASVKLAFSYNLQRIIDYILTPPTGTTPYVVTSYTMSPTLLMGDVVMVEEVSNASDLVADPETGDIIAFYSPNDPQYIVIHRVINKMRVDETWYFQTKGDANYSPDYWSGNNTYNGMLSENYLIGNVSSRVPLLGYLLGYSYYPYPQGTVAPRMSLWKAIFSSVQSMSVQLSYSSADKRFDFQFTLAHRLKALVDEIALILPEALPPETPPEIRTFVESLLNATYASVDSVFVSSIYEKGKANFEATASIEGDLSAEVNYVKDLCFQLIGAQWRRYNVTVPWQVDFINQTKVDLSNFEISAKLGETSFEGKIRGLTFMPPIDAKNATHFKLERFFNLTAPQYPGQQEFPGQNQKLKITIEGGSNATHVVAIFRDPQTVPEPDFTAPDGRSMVWFNQTLSSLKDLVFKIELRPTGTLTVTTTPVAGEILVNGTSWGLAPQSRVVQIGTYTVSFGAREGYTTPANQLAIIYENIETSIEGVYQPIPGIVVAEITRPELISATNPFIVNATKDAATYITISQISHPVTIIIKNITEPVGVQPPPGTWKVLGNYVQITVNNTDITVNATIRIYYTLEQLEASGLDENTLQIHFWNTTSEEWEPIESHVNTEEHHVWAVIDHFSLFAIMGQPSEAAAPLPTQLWFLAIVSVVIIAVIIVSTIYIRRRKTAIKSREVPESSQTR